MGLYDRMNPVQMNPFQMMSQLQRNPAAILRQRGLQIPDGMTNPQQIVQHLLQSGQIPQARYQNALRTMGINRE